MIERSSVQLALISFMYILLNKSALAENYCTDFNPCKNLAECLRHDEDPSRVRCVCKRGFNGNLCEIWPKTCNSDYCFNGGTCVIIRKIPRCLCQPEFKGLFCENFTFPRQPVSEAQASTAPTVGLNTTKEQVYFTQSTTQRYTQQEIKNNPGLIPVQENPQTSTYLYPNPASFSYSSNPPFNFVPQTASYYYNEPTKPKTSICDFDPCLNYGSCVLISNINSPFKFRCICPEFYHGILCESFVPPTPNSGHFNYVGSYQEPQGQLSSQPTPFSTEYFTTTPSTTTTTTITTPTTTSTTTTTPTTTTTTSTTTPTTSTTTEEFFTEPYMTPVSNYFYPGASDRRFRKYSLCSQLRPCANNGQCIDNDKNGENVQKFKCICRPEFTGVFCHIKVNRRANVCAYNLCLNSGECVPARDNKSFTCICPPSFTGKFCEINSY